MAFDATGLSVGSQLIGGRYRTWIYRTSDAFSTVDDTDYFALMGDGLSGSYKMALGDFIIVEKTTDGSVVLAYVSAVDSDYNATVTALAFGGALSGAVTMDSTLVVTGATTLSSVSVTGTANIGDAAADLLAFHGTTAVSQRSGSNQASSNVVTSASFGTLQVAQMNELQNAMTQLGLWKGS